MGWPEFSYFIVLRFHEDVKKFKVWGILTISIILFYLSFIVILLLSFRYFRFYLIKLENISIWFTYLIFCRLVEISNKL